MKRVTLNPEEEKDFELLRKMGRKLHVPIPEAKWKLEVFLRGNLIQSYEARSHSWTRNAYNMMFSELAGKDGADVTFEAGKISAKDTGGVIYGAAGPISISPASNASVDATARGYRHVAGEDGKGIQVGSGVNAEDFEDFILQTPIVDGTGAGELNYIESEVHSVSYAALTMQNELVRYFNNNTVGETSVDVNEVALTGAIGAPGEVGVKPVLMARDKLASTVTVPSTGQLKVTYTVSLIYPS